MEDKKKQLGQYFTTNCDYIFSGFDLEDKEYNFIEPFCGAKDLVKWVQNKNGFEGAFVEMYDLDPQFENIIEQDTLLNPPDYKGKFVVTNPPFLARNKNKDKTLYDKHQTNDLYKVFIKTLVEGQVNGGVVILPLNFICAQENTIRDLFFSNYTITKLNIFEETVFNDTTYTICSFMFAKGKQQTKIPTTIFPSKKKINLDLRPEWSWRPAGFLYEPRNKENPYKIDRLVEAKKDSIDKSHITSIYLRAVDGGSQNNRIGLKTKKEPYYGKITDRVFATLTCNEKLSDKEEKEIIKEFNERFEKLRKENYSLFLTNYRNSSSSYARKRVSFRMCYGLIEKIICEIKDKKEN